MLSAQQAQLGSETRNFVVLKHQASGMLHMHRYQDYQADDIPTVKQDGVSVRVMAGSHQGTAGPIVMRNPGLLMDVTISKGATFNEEVSFIQLYLLVYALWLAAVRSSCWCLPCGQLH